MAKRKLLWGNKRPDAAPVAAAVAAPITTSSFNSWETVEFAEDGSGAQASKFQRLMGVKNGVGGSPAPPAEEKDTSAIAQRAQMFSNMERQFEVARKVTHSAKGKGFGNSAPVAQKKYF